jgi:hypothetical protein
MCHNVEWEVHEAGGPGADVLRDAMPPPFDLPDGGGTLHCQGEFPHYYVTNGCCGCGSISGPREGAGRLEPLRFLSFFLEKESVSSVEVLWWWGEKPEKPRQQWVHWSEFMRLNKERGVESGVAYLVHGKPTSPRRT